MSRRPSPGPSQHLHSQQQMFHQIPLNSSAASAKAKNKPYGTGITASVEDVKYQSKYKELKKKVKEIESDNDRLYLKVLLAKKNIRRMNLERAILYERLAAVPPTPGRHNQELPPEQDPMFVQQPPGPAEHPHPVDVDERALEEYLRHYPNARVVTGPDGNVVAIEDPSAHSSRGGLGLTGPPPPNGVRIIQGFNTTESGAGYDHDRQAPAAPAPLLREIPQHEVHASTNNHTSNYHAEPTRQAPSNHHSHTHSHSHSSSHRPRGSSSRHDPDQIQGEPQRLDTLPPTRGGHSRSSSLSREGQVEPRARRHDIHELTSQHGHTIPHPRIDVSAPNLPPSPQSVHSPTHSRSLHNHQRIGPGVHLHRQQDRDPEVTRQLMLEREAEREREREREIAMRERLAQEEEEYRALGYIPQDVPLTGPGMSRARSRSDTPGSNGGSGASSHPDSGHSYERERERERRSYAAPRVANLLSNPRESYHDSRDERMGPSVSHSRSYHAEYNPAVDSSRKRSRHDMEIDEERGVDRHSPRDTHGQGRYMGSAAGPSDHYDIRGSKRVHPDEDDRDLGHVSSLRDEKAMDQDD